jgi:dihydroorotate dehydrogenase
MTKEDFNKKIESGASLVQIYTGFIIRGPKIIKEILN